MPSARIDISNTSVNQLVAAPASVTPNRIYAFIRVWGYSFTTQANDAANGIAFLSGSTEKVSYTFTQNGDGISIPNGPEPVFDCAPGEPLNIQQSAGVVTEGTVRYSVVMI